MTLDEWMDREQWTDAQMAQAIGVKHRLSVLKYRIRGSIPRPEVMARIATVTGGEVMPEDFYGLRNRS